MGEWENWRDKWRGCGWSGHGECESECESVCVGTVTCTQALWAPSVVVIRGERIFRRMFGKDERRTRTQQGGLGHSTPVQAVRGVGMPAGSNEMGYDEACTAALRLRAISAMGVPLVAECHEKRALLAHPHTT